MRCTCRCHTTGVAAGLGPCRGCDPNPVDPNGWEEPYDDDPPDDGANQPEGEGGSR